MASQLDNKLLLQDWRGIDRISDPEQIQDNEFVLCENFINEQGYLKRRAGTVKLADEFNTILTNINYLVHNGISSQPFYISNNKRVIANAGDGVPYAAVGLPPTAWDQLTGFAGRLTLGVQFNTKAYLGFSGLYSWTGAGLGVVGPIANAPAGPIVALAVHRGRVWAVGSTTVSNPGMSRLHFSDANNGDAWQAASTIDINPSDGDSITGLAVVNDVLLIFKLQSVYALYNSAPNPADWVVRRVSDAVGCLGQNCIAEYKGTLYFVSSKGIFKTDGVNFVEISEKIIDPSIFVDWAIISATSLTKCHLVRYQDWIVFLPNIGAAPNYLNLGIPNGVVTPYNRVFVYDVTRDSWYTWVMAFGMPQGILAIEAETFDGSGDGIYMTYLSDVYLLRKGNPVYQDDGVAYTSKFRTKHLSLDPYSMKRFKNLNFRYDSNFAAAAAVNMYGLVDKYLDAGTTDATTLLSMGDGDLSQSGSLNGRARQAGSVGLRRFRKIALECQTAGNGPFSFYNMQLNYTVARRIGRASYRGEASTDA